MLEKLCGWLWTRLEHHPSVEAGILVTAVLTQCLEGSWAQNGGQPREATMELKKKKPEG